MHLPPQLFEITTTFIIYFIVLLSIGMIACHYTKNYEDYVLGGRSLNSVITALGVGASDMSSWLMLALPGLVYSQGLSQIWMPVGLLLGAYINWRFIAKRLRLFTEKANNALTIPAYFDGRFEDSNKTLRIVSAVVVLVFFIFYAAAGFVGGANLFALAFDIPYHQALFWSTPVIIIYASMGGFLAVNWVDLFQGFLMLFALLILPIIAILKLNGPEAVFQTVHNIDATYTHLSKDLTLVGIISLMGWGLGYFGQLHLLVRFMAAKTPKVITQARRVCLSWMVLTLLGAILVGFTGIAYFQTTPLKNPEHVFLEFAKTLVNPWISGILLAAVLSAIISTVAAQLLAASSALAEDFYHALIHPRASEKTLMWVGRSTVIIVATLALVLSLDPNTQILGLVKYAWGGLGASFGPVILCSLYWRNMTKMGAISGIIAGGLTVVFWHVLSVYYPAAEAVYEILPGFIVGLIAIFLGSWRGPPPSRAMLQTFSEFEHELKQYPG